MRIVDRKTFLTLPNGTVYAKYEPYCFGELSIKDDSLTNDWFYRSIHDAIDRVDSADFAQNCRLAESQDMPMNFEIIQRDGCFEDDQLFSVWSEDDIKELIEALQQALIDRRESITEIH